LRPLPLYGDQPTKIKLVNLGDYTQHKKTPIFAIGCDVRIANSAIVSGNEARKSISALTFITISVGVMDAGGKLSMECLLETKAAMIVEFIQGLHGTLSLAFEEGISAAVSMVFRNPCQPGSDQQRLRSASSRRVAGQDRGTRRSGPGGATLSGTRPSELVYLECDASSCKNEQHTEVISSDSVDRSDSGNFANSPAGEPASF